MKKIVSIFFVLIVIWCVFSTNSQRKIVQEEGKIMNKKEIGIEFPLRGEWFTKVSPADRVPSHGIDRFGLTYAFDFIKVDWDKPDHPTHDKNKLDYFLGGIPLNSYYCFGEPIMLLFREKLLLLRIVF